MTTFSILCSAPGTRLSGTLDQLREKGGIAIQDVEEELKTRGLHRMLHPSQLKAVGANPDMAAVCQMLGRDVVSGLWAGSVQTCLESLLASDADHRVLACHLTLFNAQTLEFYSPLQPSLFTFDGAPKPERIILLIDDIFDMYRALSPRQSLLDDEYAHSDYKSHAIKLVACDERPPKIIEASIEEDISLQNLLKLESQVERLKLMLMWRRTEMIVADLFARSLDVPLTVLGVKHSVDALLTLVQAGRKAKTAYLSHKITAARMYNRRRAKQGCTNCWPSFVGTVNRLPLELIGQGIVVIQPTAIDELRFVTPTGSLTERAGGLGDRWPLPGNSLFERTTEDCTDQNTFFDVAFDSGAVRATASGVIRSLEKQVYDEIAFRDHLLVHCNDYLLVFRPLIHDGRLSSGVRRETQHWSQYWYRSEEERKDKGSETTRRAVFIHLADDILGNLKTKSEKDRFSFTRNLRDQAQEYAPGFSEEQFDLWWESGGKISSEQLHRLTALQAQQIQEAYEEAAPTAILHTILQWCCHAYIDAARKGIGIFVADHEQYLLSSTIWNQVTRFFEGKLEAMEVNHRAAEVVHRHSGFQDWLSFARAIASGQGFGDDVNPGRGW